MSHTDSTHKKRIDSIGQPDDDALLGLDILSYPLKQHGRAAVATFKNGAELRFQIREGGTIHQETYFPDGTQCESFEVDNEILPSVHLNSVLNDYSSISAEDLRTSRPGLWPILDIDD